MKKHVSKRILATALPLLLALTLLLCPALSAGAEEEQANEAIATCELPAGAEALPAQEASGFAVPEGLEDMYALMLDCSPNATVYLMRMKNGRALLSIASADVAETGTAQSLLEKWPAIANGVSRQVSYVNADESCAMVEERYGREALVIQTDIAVGVKQMTLLDASCTAFYRDKELIEVWAVYPASPAYLYDDAAAAELQSDMADLEAALSSLNFNAPSGTSRR